jgi:transcription antitermination factor NusG
MDVSLMNGLRSVDSMTLGTPREQHWYALYTRARHEKVVTAALQQRGLTVFLPQISQIHRWSDRRQKVQVPLFPGYTFVRTTATAESFVHVLKTPGIVGFVGAGGRGSSIPEKQIEDIRTVLTQDVACALHPFLRVGQRVCVRGGCLDGVEGLLVGINGNKSLVISVESMPRSIAICIDGYDVEILSAEATAA